MAAFRSVSSPEMTFYNDRSEVVGAGGLTVVGQSAPLQTSSAQYPPVVAACESVPPPRASPDFITSASREPIGQLGFAGPS